jgi:hypothetical protein
MGVDSLGRLIVMGGMDTNGYDVADVWRSQRLGSPDTPPVLTQVPGTNAAYGVTYTSTIAATGNPQPVYVLVSGPTNMTVDYFTGQITWTPSGADQIGAIPITVAATNYAGFTNYTFNINATPPPPTIPTNLTAVAITDYSVTMSWAPESPLVGPATYNVYERHVVITRSGGYATYNKVNSGLTGTSATIAGLAVGSHHTYVVTAVASGIETPYSAMLSITTTSPQPPSNLRLTGLTSTTISFAWDPSPGPAQSANYSTITSYIVSQRNTAYSPPVNTAILSGVPTTSATVTGQTPGAVHLWIVQGTDTQGLTSANFAFLFVTNPIPVAPLMSSGGPGSNGNFQFTVQEQGSVVQTIWVQANTSLVNPAGWVQIGSTLPGSSIFTFTDTNAAQYPTRFYRTVAP